MAAITLCAAALAARWSRPAVMCSPLLLAVAVAAGPSLFSGSDPLSFQLTAPFNELFTYARDDDSYTVTGTLIVPGAGAAGRIDNVRIGVRGNTSRRESECTFPKLKITFPAAPGGPPFAGMKSIKIGTHCGEAQQHRLTARFGRLANQQSPRREAFVYTLLEALEVPALKARPAVITYVFADSTPEQPRSLERHALLLEDSDAAIKRIGGRREIDEREFTTARALFTPDDTVGVVFAEALLGNFDWCLKMSSADNYRCDRRHPVWNITAAATGDGKARPLLHDFDVSGIVTGEHPWFKDVFNAAFVPSQSPIETEVLAQVQRARTLFSRAELDRARRTFVARKSQAVAAIDAAALDAEGRRVARAYVDAFFNAIESDAAFYRPVVVAPGTAAYATGDRKPVCRSGIIPPGTPVSDPIRTDGTLVQVLLLDALWHWAPPVRCQGIRGPVWIEAAAVGRDFPAR